MKKIIIIFETWYKNKYSFSYLIDAFTERQLKYRKGKCPKNCGLCCRYVNGGNCKHLTRAKRCRIYNERNCNINFPVSQEELDHFYKIFKDFKCGYSFEVKK